MRCPICKKQVALDGPEMPFCSKRCRLIDLGNWADERYAIPSEGLSEFAEQLESEDDDYQGRVQ